MKFYFFCALVLSALASPGELLSRLAQDFQKKERNPLSGNLSVSADYMSASRSTGELLATGHVSAVSKPYRFLSNRIQRTSDGIYSFGTPAWFTTCSNELEHVHWDLEGDFTYIQDQALVVKNAWLKYQNVPIFYVPIWYYPLNTDYGLRVTPGYRSRWGGFILTKYVYDLLGEGRGAPYRLGASTSVDYRTKNGFGLGQAFRWGLGEWGHGKISAYSAWDNDYDRYTRSHWNGHRRNYQNWGSDVDRQRYRILLEHTAQLTERDDVHVHATFYSDSHMNRDFFEDARRLESIPANEAWYEHRELSWAAGGSVSGPLNEFYSGTSRLPEGWLNVAPQPIFDWPINYESQSRVGYLNHDYARYGSSDPMYHYVPYVGLNGRGADYQAFRMDTSHRLTAPFKLGDVVSFVPRASYRGTYWSDSASRESAYLKSSGEGLFRSIYEVGFTASARGTANLSEKTRHTIEPYLDYSYQGVNLSSGSRRRYYSFDNYDRSVDWLDQFGFEGRGLPTSWHGLRPGVRNFFEQANEKGVFHNVFDWDVYAAIPFETIHEQTTGPLAGYPTKDTKGNYNRKGKHQVVPGTSVRWKPSKDIRLTSRVEYDCQNSEVAYADVIFHHQLAQNFSYYVSYIGRDYRTWDYLPSNVDRWNEQLCNVMQVGFEHALCDWISWSPYVRFDVRRNELEEVGTWLDFLSDCLGYRFQFEHETSFDRIDGSKEPCDTRIMFFVYLRALGPSSMLNFAHF